MKRLPFVFFLTLLSVKAVNAQDFLNQWLNGPGAISSALPDNWQSIPSDFHACLASLSGITDTPDLTNDYGPNEDIGIACKPYISYLCVTGIYGYSEENHAFYHEGIQQTVHGLTPGVEYQLSFYQSVVKQVNIQDSVGIWKVYMDDVYLDESDPTYSQLPYDEIDVNWEKQEMTFIAKLDSHNFKFLPWNVEGESKRVRMGIDLIKLECKPIYTIPNDTTICDGHSLIVDVSSHNATYSWNDGYTGPVREITEAGKYSVTIENGCDNAKDAIEVKLKDCPVYLELPNVFTPNNDGVNDIFRPVQISEIQSWHLVVVNRWGDIVFQSVDPTYYWNGTHEGEYCSDGVYFWRLNATDTFNQEIEQYGTVHLIDGFAN